MGKRSKVPALQKQIRQAYRSRKMAQLRHGPWDCPWCHAHKMFADIRGSGRLILFACGSCHMGEMLPRLPNYEIVDIYHRMLDYYLKKTPAVFKVKKILGKDYRYIVNHVSLGTIEAVAIVDEHGDVEEGNSLEATV